MRSTGVDSFKKGVDLRRPASASGGDTLRLAKNCFLTTGHTIKKRQGLILVATLEAGTAGLSANNGKLNTFYDSGAVITHANALFVAHRIKNPTTDSAVTRIWYSDAVAGYMYVSAEYANGSVWHHYLEDPGTWEASTVYGLGAFRRPVTVNGFRYEVTVAGTSDVAEPIWPTTLAATVVDGTVTWTCRSTYIADANCPHGRSLTKAVSKMWSVKKEAPFDIVRFCATAQPRDWTTGSDAGFLPVALSQENAQDCYAVGLFQNQLVAYFQDSIQLWNIDPDPALNKVAQKLFGSGTRHPASIASFADDSFFLADAGVRSVTISTQTANLQDSDVGSPVDAALPLDIGLNEPVSLYVSTFGQYWLLLGSRIWVYSFSRMAKLSAWSYYDMPFSVDAVATLDNVVYLRSGNAVYRFSADVYRDNGAAIPVEIEMPYLDLKSAGDLKQIMGLDLVGVGTCSVQLRIDPRNPSIITPPAIMSGDSRSTNLTPVEALAVSVAPVIKHSANEPFELAAMQFYFERLGFDL